MTMVHTTATSQALTRREVYSDIILDTLDEGYLPEGISRDLSDAPVGDTIFVTTVGDVLIKDMQEGVETPTTRIDTDELTLSITEYEGVNIAISDESRQDAYKMSQLDSMAPGKMLRALKESYETKLLAVGESVNGQTKNDPNQINGIAHRICASGPNGSFALTDVAYAKLAFQKANVPTEGMIAIVDPLDEHTINTLTQLVSLDSNPQFRGIVETGFGKGMRFLRSIYGVDFYISNRLSTFDTETIDATANGGTAPTGQAGAVTVTNGHAVLFMNVASDDLMPFMSAWRARPSIEYGRVMGLREDHYQLTARYGFGMHRSQSLVTVLTAGQ